MNNAKRKIRILITGGTGFLGSYAVKYYASQKYTVRALVRKNNAKKLHNTSGIELAYGDMKDRKSILDATKNVDYIINFAALKSDEKDSYDVNVSGVEYLIEGAKKNNLSKIIQISTLSTKIKKLGIYGKTKAKADKVLIESNIPFVILRPSVIYGDLSSGVFGSLVQASSLPVIPIFGDGKCFFYPIHVEDLIKVTEIAILNKKLIDKIYDIGGQDKITFNALVQLVARECGKKPYLFHIHPIIGIIFAKILSKIFYRPPITVSNILGSTQDVVVDVKTFMRDFNFTPRPLLIGVSGLFTNKDSKTKEAKLFFSYVLPKEYWIDLSAEIYERYNFILQKNGIESYKNIPKYFSFILGPLDAFSKLFFPNSRLQKKLLIVSTIIEASPYSASWLLPKLYSNGGIFVILSKLFIISAIKFVFGFLLYLIPGLYKKYVI